MDGKVQDKLSHKKRRMLAHSPHKKMAKLKKSTVKLDCLTLIAKI